MTAGSLSIEPQETGLSTITWDIPRLTLDTAWRVLRTASGNSATGKLFLHGRQVSLHEFWPGHGAAPDLTRLTAPYFAWARDVQTLDRPLFEALTEALAPQIRRRGLAGGPTQAEIFFGDYRCTPGGIHREACSNLHLVLAGEKTLHFWFGDWPPPGTNRRADTASGVGTREEYLPDLDPAAAFDQSTSRTSTAGGGVGWTSGTWHVAETCGQSTALNIAAYHRELSDRSLLPVWGEQIYGRVPTRWFARFRAHIGIAGPPEAALASLSSLGMRPAATTRPYRKACAVRPRLAVPVLWITERSDLLIATLGAVRRQSADTPLDWLTHLSYPDPVTVPAGAEAVAAWLCQQGVLDIVEET